MLICKEKLHILCLSFEMNIFWPVYKQHGLFPTTVNSNHKISSWEELLNTFSNNHFVIIYDDPAQDVFIFFGNFSLWWKSDKIKVSKLNKNDSTPSRELLVAVLLTQPLEIIFAFYCLVLCFELCRVRAVSLRVRYVPLTPKALLTRSFTVSTAGEISFFSFPFLYFLYSLA